MHNGNKSIVYLYPSDPNNGIRINNLKMNPAYILSTNGMTKHGFVSQVEHLLSALYACGINNINISIDNDEMPILCGGTRMIIDEILKVGVKLFEEETEKFILDKEIIVRNKDSFVKFTPGKNETDFICNVDFHYVGEQSSSWNKTDFDFYYNNISNAKTFFGKNNIKMN